MSFPRYRQRFWLNFLPEDRRSLRPTGIHLFGLRYWSPALSADVGRVKSKLLVKYDPRDLARVFVQRPSGSFVEARYADITLPSVTLHEVNAKYGGIDVPVTQHGETRRILPQPLEHHSS